MVSGSNGSTMMKEKGIEEEKGNKGGSVEQRFDRRLRWSLAFGME